MILWAPPCAKGAGSVPSGHGPGYFTGFENAKSGPIPPEFAGSNGFAIPLQAPGAKTTGMPVRNGKNRTQQEKESVKREPGR